MTTALELLNSLPPVLAYPAGALLVYRWGLIPAVRGTLATVREWRELRTDGSD